MFGGEPVKDRRSKSACSSGGRRGGRCEEAGYHDPDVPESQSGRLRHSGADGEVQGHADLQDGRCTVVLLPRCAAETYGLRDDACEGAGDSFRARGAGERVVFNCVEKIESIFEMKIYF